MKVGLKNRLAWAIGFGLLLGVLALYGHVLDCDFLHYDDNKYVTQNPHVRAGLTWEGLGWAFQAGYASNWHPLTWISHMADCQLFGLNPRGHHLTNLVFHLANTILLFAVFRRMTGALWQSAMVAALFALHPLHVESVAWVAERKDVLSAFFFLLTLGAYGRYAQAPTSEGGLRAAEPVLKLRHRRGYYLLALVFFVLGLMSKPMLVTLPFVLLLLDYWPLRRFEGTFARRLLYEKLPFIALAVSSSLITLRAQRRGGSVVPLEVLPFDSRCVNALVSYLRYAGKLVWPHDLSVVYPYVSEWPLWLLALAAGFVVLATLLALTFRRQAPYLLVGWFWYLGTLVPVIGLVQVGEQAMADRYTYLPAIGLFLAICWAVPQGLSQWPGRRPALVFGATLALAACSLASRAQLRHWGNSYSLFAHAVSVTKHNAVAHDSLGVELMNLGRLGEAMHHYELALQISPNYSLAHNNLGVALARLGRFDEAIAHYRAGLTLHPEDAEVHFNLANALNPGFVGTYAAGGPLQNDRPDAQQSREHYQAALAIDPNLINAQINWGNLELTEGQYEAARAHYEEAIRLELRNALAHFDLGNVLVRMGRTNDAIASYTKAVEIQPGNPEGHFKLANLLASEGDWEHAIAHYERVVSLSPGHFVACNNLGTALARLDKLEEASRQFSEAIRLNPDYAEAHSNLGRTLELQGKRESAIAQYQEALRLVPEAAEVHRWLALVLEKQGRNDAALAQFAEVARQRPENPGAQYDLAMALAKNGRSDLAVEPFRAALRLKPEHVQSLNNLAWILATHPNGDLRRGTEAVDLAKRACELTGFLEPRVLGTLDAAYAEAGQFDKAIEMAGKTRDLAMAAGKGESAERARERLKLYQAGKPFHESGNNVSK